MFVHNRASPFNHRVPNKGSDMLPARQDFVHRPNAAPPLSKPSRSSTSAASAESVLLLRPIATNSRIKQHKNLYIVFVNNALEQKARGNSEPYEELVTQFSTKAVENGTTSTHQLRQWLNALTHVVSQLDRQHVALVEAIVTLPWHTMDDSLVKTYKNSIGILVSARPEYLQTVLARIVQSLTHQAGLKAKTADGKKLTRGTMFDRIHSLLQELFDLIPTLPSTLYPLLVQYFPHKRESRFTQLLYIRNLLRIIDYCPEVAEDVLSTIIDRAIQIDVEVQIEVEELEEAEDAPDEEEMFALDPFETVVGENGPDSDSDDDYEDDGDLGGLSDVSSNGDELETKPDPTRSTSQVQELVQKLDAILRVIFEHFTANQTRIVSPDPDIDLSTRERALELRRSQFLSLMTIFENIILRTFKSRYTQFVVFWYTSLDEEYVDLFLGLLVSRAVRDHSQPPVTRAAAASYIASFVSRALFVGRETTRRVTDLFCTFLANHIASMGIPGQQHTVFYGVCQALFLIFCFRWRDLLLEDDRSDDEEESDASPTKASRRWLPGLDILHQVVMSPLNPLKVCSHNVVGQFARVSQHTGFMYCYPIIDGGGPAEVEHAVGASTPGSGAPPGRAGLVAVTSAAASGSATPVWAGGVEQELHSFFPFDPYGLPLSQSYISGIYREWSAVAIDDGEDSGDEEEGGDEQASLVIEARRGVDEETATLGTSFGGMSISPQNVWVPTVIGVRGA
ncbi:RNA polymerase I-specific transcription initiation factor RRN3 [Auriculariales sp. MPI-PUGE-AT-0066]|nr:RNA polymerase I-specific transcription initiation factor RRN3 [Auriculariales sp. MPI-PUGE-AT-0066]